MCREGTDPFSLQSPARDLTWDKDQEPGVSAVSHPKCVGKGGLSHSKEGSGLHHLMGNFMTMLTLPLYAELCNRSARVLPGIFKCLGPLSR